MLGCPLGHELSPVPGEPNLWAGMLDGRVAFEAWLAEELGPRGERIARRSLARAVGGSLSGTHEWLALRSVAKLAAAFDDVIVDTAPGTHLLDFLGAHRRLPALFGGLPGGVAGTVLGWLAGASFGPVRTLLAAMSDLSGSLQAVERDIDALWASGRVDAVLTTRADLPDRDGREPLVEGLRGHGIRVAGLLLNRAEGEPGPPLRPVDEVPANLLAIETAVRAADAQWRRRHGEQSARAEALRQSLGGAAVVRLPVVDATSRDALRALGRLGDVD